MRGKWVFIAGLIAAAAPDARGVEPITPSNWHRHPAIVEAKVVHQEVKRAETGRLRKLQRKFEQCRSYEDTERTLYLDTRGVVRSYYFSGGSEDSAAQHAHYYDRHGNLRFVYVTAGAVNGTRVRYRTYLSKTGQRLWDEHKRQGPGWTFPSRLPEEELIKNPKQAFDGENPCPEAK